MDSIRDTLSAKMDTLTEQLRVIAIFLSAIEYCKKYKSVDKKLCTYAKQTYSINSSIEKTEFSIKVCVYFDKLSGDDRYEQFYFSLLNTDSITWEQLENAVNGRIEGLKESIEQIKKDLNDLHAMECDHQAIKAIIEVHQEKARAKYGDPYYLTEKAFPILFKLNTDYIE